MAGGAKRWLIPGAIAIVAALVASVAVIVLAGSDPAGASVTLERAGTPGVDPFTASVTIGEIAEFPDTIRAITSGLEPDPETGGLQAEGTTPGLYGGTQNETVCDPGQLVAFLEEDADKARAWAGVLGIQADAIPDYVAGLTPLILLGDVRVTNHGFESDTATSFQAVLQSGTAVLVDDLGVPRVKCYSGNPLTAPDDVKGTVTYTGTAWPSFDAAASLVIAPADQPVESFEIANLTGPPEVVGAIDVGDSVGESTFRNGVLWTATFGGPSTPSGLVRIDAETGEGTEAVRTDGNVLGLAATTTDLWVLEITDADYGPKLISGTLIVVRIDAETRQEIATVEFGPLTYGFRNPAPDIVVTDNGQVWVSQTPEETYGLARIDPETNSVAETIAVPEAAYAALVASGSSLWLGGRTFDDSGTLLRIDPATSAVEPVPVGDAVYSLAAAKDGDVWVGLGTENPDPPDEASRGPLPGTGRIVRISADGQIGEEITIGDATYDLAVDGDRVWAVGSVAFEPGSSSPTGSVLRIDTIDASVETVEVSGEPAGVTVGDGVVFTGAGTEILEITPFAVATVPVGSSGAIASEQTAEGAPTFLDVAEIWMESERLTNLGPCDLLRDLERQLAQLDEWCTNEPELVSDTSAYVIVSEPSSFGENRIAVFVDQTANGGYVATRSACNRFLRSEQSAPQFLLGPDGQLQLDETACQEQSRSEGGE